MGETRDLDEAIGRSALGKAARRLLPVLALGYGIAYMDRINISFATLQMNQELHFSASVYGLGAGLFFLSYALFEIPSNLLLVKYGARRWIARIMLTWGVLAVAMMFVRSPAQFYGLRFLLGMAEAGFFPGVIYYLTTWFPAAHSGRAVSRFYVAIPLSAALMGAMAGPLLGLQGIAGLAGWQWLFLVEGIPGLMLGVFIYLRLPDGPGDARWLSPEERDWISSRVVPDARRESFRERLSDALNNVAVWKLGLCNFFIMGSGYAFTLSVPALLTGSTRWTVGQVGTLMSLTGLGGAVIMILNGWHSDRRRERHWHTFIPLALMAGAIAATGMSYSPFVLLPAYVIYYWASAATQATFWPISSDHVRGRAAAVGLAAINSIGMLGAFLGPYAWGVARDLTGSYRVGLVGVAVASALAAVMLHTLQAHHVDATPAEPPVRLSSR